MSQTFVMIIGVNELLIGPKQVFLSLPAKTANNNKFSSQIIGTSSQINGRNCCTKRTWTSFLVILNEKKNASKINSETQLRLMCIFWFITIFHAACDTVVRNSASLFCKYLAPIFPTRENEKIDLEIFSYFLSRLIQNLCSWHQREPSILCTY